VYGAWIDLTKRKLRVPPVETKEMFDFAERSEDFEVISLKK
jgi:acyl-CoA thioester hydrolase